MDETKGVSMLSTAIAFVPYQVSVYTILRLASLVKAVSAVCTAISESEHPAEHAKYQG